MPSRSAAWMTVFPSSTSTFRPSISTVGTRRLLRAERAAPERSVLLVLRTILRDEGADGHRRRVGERADRVPHHVAGDVEQEVDVARLRRALFQVDEHLVEPARALAARRALPARLVMEEALEDHRR